MAKSLQRRSSSTPSEVGEPQYYDGKEVEIFCAELPPHEIALSFDHILEQIFKSLSISDLLTCRMVSHRFLKFAQVPLEKGLQIQTTFIDNQHYNMHRDEYSGRTLVQLTDFLTSSLASESLSNRISFPCSDFGIIGAGIDDPKLQDFLNTNGQNIRHLSISWDNEIHESIVMEHICNLLTSQAPFLESLFLSVECEAEWQREFPDELPRLMNTNYGFREHGSPLLKADPEYQQICTKAESLRNKSCLKNLTINGEGFAKVLELICQISPNLKEVTLDKNRYHMYLLEPVSRVNLLSSLSFQPELNDPYDNCSMEIMERISKDNNLALRHLRIYLDKVLSVCNTNPEFVKRVVSVFNEIMEQSRDTLKNLFLTSVTFLRGMKMPSSMAQVRTLEIQEFHQRYDATVFPIGFNLSATFPKLTCVKLRYYAELVDFDVFNGFLNCLDFQGNDDPTLSLSVTKVIVNASCFLTPERLKIIPPAFISERVQKLFPNARVEYGVS